jgi:hypothetical protein
MELALEYVPWIINHKVPYVDAILDMVDLNVQKKNSLIILRNAVDTEFQRLPILMSLHIAAKESICKHFSELLCRLINILAHVMRDITVITAVQMRKKKDKLDYELEDKLDYELEDKLEDKL